MLIRRQLLGMFVGLCLSAFTTSALAQTDEERAGARALAEQGGVAFQEGRWQDAVDLFTRAQSVVDAPPHLLYIARSQAKLGNLVQAMEAYIKVTRADLDEDAPDAFRDAQAEAQTELDALTPRIPHVAIKLKGGAPDDLVVKVDGEPLPNAFIGVERPANPGEHKYTAEGTGVMATPLTLNIAEGENKVVELDLKPVETAAPAVAAPQPDAAPTTPSDMPPGAEAPPSGSSDMPAYIALGVGAVGLGMGTYFLIHRSSLQSDADAEVSHCQQSGDCGEDARKKIEGLDNDAASAGTMSWVGFGVGVAGAGVGLALLLMGDDTDTAQNPNTPGVGLWANGNQLGLQGRF